MPLPFILYRHKILLYLDYEFIIQLQTLKRNYSINLSIETIHLAERAPISEIRHARKSGSNKPVAHIPIKATSGFEWPNFPCVPKGLEDRGESPGKQTARYSTLSALTATRSGYSRPWTNSVDLWKDAILSFPSNCSVCDS